MNSKAMTYVAALFIALTIVMAGLFVYEYSASSSQQVHYNSVKADYQNQQSSVVMNDAYAHWDYIAIENTSLLMPQYSANATLHWIGGPLTGNYIGTANISSVWNEFFGIWSAVWYYTVTPPEVTVNGTTAKVVSLNQFVLTPYTVNLQAQYLNISYSLTYMEENNSWLILSETWHIVGSGYISTTQQFALSNYVENLAFSHWNNIAIENNTTVMQQYESNATLHWIGGPLNGVYSGLAQINETWNKFFGLWSAVWFYAEAPPVVIISGNTANVSANIQFVVQNSANTSQFKYINVTYNIMYFNTGFSNSKGLPVYMIYDETFQITGSSSLNKV